MFILIALYIRNPLIICSRRTREFQPTLPLKGIHIYVWTMSSSLPLKAWLLVRIYRVFTFHMSLCWSGTDIWHGKRVVKLNKVVMQYYPLLIDSALLLIIFSIDW